MVRIYKDYYLEADSLQYKLLQKKVSGKSNNEYFNTVGYYTKLESVFCRIIEQCGRDAIMDENVKSMKQVFETMNDTALEIREIMDEIMEKVSCDQRAEKTNDDDDGNGEEDEEEMLDM